LTQKTSKYKTDRGGKLDDRSSHNNSEIKFHKRFWAEGKVFMFRKDGVLSIEC
jgi:hypothetical protein